MNNENPSDGRVPQPDDMDAAIADANIERLLREAYRPEHPAPDFAARVERELVALAGSRTKAPHARAPFARSSWSMPRIVWRCAGIAAVIAIAIGVPFWLSNGREDAARHQVRWDGPTVWVDGRAYRSVDDPAVADPHHVNNRATTSPLVSALFTESPGGLAPKPRAKAPPVTQPAAPGQTFQTKAGQRRTLGLGADSKLMLDENTTVTIHDPLHVTIPAGQVFVDVSPRAGGAGEVAAVVLTTPTRSIRAPGGKFDVHVDGKGTDVFVTQGKVQVSGGDLAAPVDVSAGQRFSGASAAAGAGAASIQSAPRASAALDWTRELVAACESPLVPASHYAGGALVAVDPSGQEARLELRDYHVDVHIEDGFARTTIDQTYFNREARRMEGTFYFPLPADAQLSRLAMYVNGQLMEGGMAERDYARTVYENIVRKMQDPALLEWVDGTTFKMRVFPLEGRQEKRIVLSYTQRLPSVYGRSDYRFPAAASLGPVSAWSFHARVKNGAPLRWESATSALKADADANDLLLDAQARAVVLDRDVTLRLYEPGADLSPHPQSAIQNPQSAKFSTFTQDGCQYLMLRYRPALPSEPVRERRDWVFLYESSADRNPLLARTQVEIIRAVLNDAEPDDTFSIITAGTRSELLTPAPLQATPANIDAALVALEKTHLIGALDLGKALSMAEPLLKSAKTPYLVHLGTGIPAMGERRDDALMSHIPSTAHYVGIGVGRRWSRAFMKSAATRSGGYHTQINPDESIAWRGFELVSTLNAPRLLALHAGAPETKGTFLFVDDAIVQGEDLCAILRLPASDALPPALSLSGRLNGQTWSQTVPVKLGASDGAAYLPRAWAKLEIDRLLAESAEANKTRVVELSKQMYVMSPFTSLLVLENEAMYEQFHVDRGRKDHWAMYPCPEKIEVKTEALPTIVAPPTLPPGSTTAPAVKPSPEQVLRTIVFRAKPPLIIRADEVERRMNPGPYWSSGGMDGNIGGGDDFIYTWSVNGGVLSLPTVFVPDDGTLYLGGQTLRGEVVNRYQPNAMWGSNGSDYHALRLLGRRFDTFTINPETSVPGTIGRELMASKFEWHRFQKDRELSRLTDDTSKQIKSLSDALAALQTRGSTGSVATPAEDLERTAQLEDLQRQANAYKARLLVDDARKAENDGRQAAARDRYTEGLRLDPNNPAAIDGRNRMLQYLGQNARAVPALTRAEQSIVVEQQTITYDFNQAISDANAATAASDFAAAHAAFDRARASAISNPGIFSPEATRHFNDTLADLNLRVQQSEEYAAMDPEREAHTLDLIRRNQEQSRRQRERTVADLTATARRLTDDGRYQDALGVAEQIKVLDPHNDYATGVAPLLQDKAAFAQQRRFRERWQVEVRRQLNQAEERKIPYDDILRYPYDWPDISGIREIDATPDRFRASTYQDGIYTADPAARGGGGTLKRYNTTATDTILLPTDDVDVRTVSAQLERRLSNVSFDGVGFSDVVDFLRDVSGANIFVDWGALERVGVDRNAPVTAHLSNVPFAEALRVILHGLATARVPIVCTIDGGVITIAPARAQLPGGSLLYRRPSVSTDARVFSDLLSYAPGMNATEADAMAVLEAEADTSAAPQRHGRVDAGAAALVSAARSAGWQQVTIPATPTRQAFVVMFDGAGRYAWERSVGLGLRERVVCDGRTLLHLYPELGVGAERTVSRFYRSAFSSLVPWALPPVEEMAIGADVTLVGERTIAITSIDPLVSEGGPATRPTTHPSDFVRTELTFALDGRLSQRAAVEMPSGRVLHREMYDADGTVKGFGADGSAAGEWTLTRRAASAPDLAPSTKELVVLPLPLRSRVSTGSIPSPVPDATPNHPYDRLNDAEARQLLADLYANGSDLQLLIARRFLHHGDRRLGLYTLLLSSGATWDAAQPFDAGGVQVAMDPVKDHASSPLAHYIVQQLKLNREGSNCDAGQFAKLHQFGDGFVPRLAVFRGFMNRWTSGHAGKGTPEQRKDEVREALLFAQACPDPYITWSVAEVLREYDTQADAQECASIAHLLKPLLNLPGLRYETQYDYAGLLTRGGEGKGARETFAKLYRETLKAGILPPIDSAFRAAFCDNAPPPEASAAWASLIRETASMLLERGDRSAALALAWQCRRVGDDALGDETLDRCVGSASELDRFHVTLSAVQYLAEFKQPARAEALLQPVLDDPLYAKYPELWRLAGVLAEQRGALARSLACRERAMAIEFDQLADEVDLQVIRQDYGKFLADYEKLASAVVALDAQPPKDLVGSIVRAADRCRSIDTDATAACLGAAKALQSLGAKDLAWEYMTSPLADHPNEPAPWQNLAQSLRQQGDVALADRAYVTASEMEPGNAQVLWDRAQLLQQAGRVDEARSVMRRIADGTWDAKYAGVQIQARGFVR